MVFRVVGFGYCRVSGILGVEELEGLALGVGGLGEDGHGGVGAGEADRVAGEGAQMGEQSLVAVGGQAGVGGGFAGCFGGGVGGSAGGCDGVVAVGGVFVGAGTNGLTLDVGAR